MRIIIVDPPVNPGYTPIQDAVDSAVPFDVIFVNNGNYADEVFISTEKHNILIQVHDSVFLLGPGGLSTGFIVDANFVEITRFSIQGFNIGFQISGNNNNINENAIGATFHNAIEIGGEYNNIRGNIIYDTDLNAIEIYSSNNNINLNTISDTSNHVVLIQVAKLNNISKNSIQVKDTFAGFEIDSGTRNNITKNQIELLGDNSYGFLIIQSIDDTINRNIITSP